MPGLALPLGFPLAGSTPGPGPVVLPAGGPPYPFELIPDDGSAGASVARDFALDAEGDLYLDANGELAITFGKASILSDVFARLQTFAGEWFLNTALGIPYIDRILVKNPDTVTVRALVRDAIETTPGVLTLDDLQLDYSGATRSLSITFRASTDLGELVGALEV